MTATAARTPSHPRPSPRRPRRRRATSTRWRQPPRNSAPPCRRSAARWTARRDLRDRRRRGRPDGRPGPCLERVRGPDRRRGGPDFRHRGPDQPAGAQRHDRGGPRRRRGPRLRGGRRRGEGAGGADRQGHRPRSRARLPGSRSPPGTRCRRSGRSPRGSARSTAWRPRSPRPWSSRARPPRRSSATSPRRPRAPAAVTGHMAGVAEASHATEATAARVRMQPPQLSAQSEHLTAEVGRFLAGVRAA